MTRTITLAPLAGLIALSFTATLQAADRPLNIVYIMADDLGYTELGCYGQTKIETPNIDRLAVQGMRFTQHYTGAPVCAPARCCLMTGMHGGHAVVTVKINGIMLDARDEPDVERFRFGRYRQ